MAVHFIAPQSTQTQYIDAVIAGGQAGDTYRLQAGIHRYQTISNYRSGDTIIFEEGAEMVGGEDLTGWSNSGGDIWTKSGISVGNFNAASLNWDPDYFFESTYWGWADCLFHVPSGRLLPWVRSTSMLNSTPYTAYHPNHGTQGTSPSATVQIHVPGFQAGDVVVLSRRTTAIDDKLNVDNVTVKADNAAQGGGKAPAEFFGIIRNYSSFHQARNAAVRGGYDVTDTQGSGGAGGGSGTGWLYQDLVVTGMGGCGIVGGDQSEMRRVHIVQNGQLGLGNNRLDDPVMRYCRIENNGVVGWRGGWEAGNSKIARTQRDLHYGCLWLINSKLGPNEGAITGVLWWDIDNDGTVMEDCIIAAGSNHPDSRGIFHEISFAIRFRRNICYRLDWDAENDGWGKAFLSSASGAIPGLTEFDETEVNENVFYECRGGAGGVQQARGNYQYKLTSYPRRCRNNHYFDNLTVWDNATIPGNSKAGQVDFHGTDPTDIDFSRNVYVSTTPTTAHFDDQQIGGAGSNLTWGQWQSAGQDTTGRMLTRTTHPSLNPDPFGGGAMAGVM